MSAKDSEYKELFLMEAKDNIEQLDKLFVRLEKNHEDAKAINEIFRITHTLKGNAMGMGFDAIGELSHLLEDVMLAIQNKSIALDQDLFKLIFRANDKLQALILSLETGKRVSYLGIKTSLSLFLEKELHLTKQTDDTETPESKESEDSADLPTENVPIEQVEEDSSTQITLSDVIQIPLKKMDELMSEMGQLVIERDRLIALSLTDNISSAELEPMKRLTSSLQYSIMNVRMVKVGFLFNKFHRVVRDAAQVEDKKVNLELKGTEVEIDRNILKIITDSLVHLIRNAVGHGIEKSDIRMSAGKAETGTIVLDAGYNRDRVVISVSDDGYGMDVANLRKKIVKKGLVSQEIAANLKDSEVIQFIFHAGFSNADQVNAISGRGVGMDVVKKAVESVGGQVKVKTELNLGSTISMELPSSLALKGTLLIELQGYEYAIGLSFSESVIKVTKNDLKKLGHLLVADYKGEAINAIFISDLFNLKQIDDINNRGTLQRSYEEMSEDQILDMIIVNYGDKRTGLVVDRVLQQKEMIEKPLDKPLDGIKIISGTSIMGSGKVCPIIDVGFIIDLVYSYSRSQEEVVS